MNSVAILSGHTPVGLGSTALGGYEGHKMTYVTEKGNRASLSLNCNPDLNPRLFDGTFHNNTSTFNRSVILFFLFFIFILLFETNDATIRIDRSMLHLFVFFYILQIFFYYIETSTIYMLSVF